MPSETELTGRGLLRIVILWLALSVVAVIILASNHGCAEDGAFRTNVEASLARLEGAATQKADTIEQATQAVVAATTKLSVATTKVDNSTADDWDGRLKTAGLVLIVLLTSGTRKLYRFVLPKKDTQ